AVTVLGALPPRLADHAAHDHRHAHRAAVHVVRLCRHVDELVHAEHEKVHADVHVHGTHSGHRRTYAEAGHGVFRQRRCEHPLRTEPFEQTLCGALDALVVVHVEAVDEDPWISLHLLSHCLGQGVDVAQHSPPPTAAVRCLFTA